MDFEEKYNKTIKSLYVKPRTITIEPVDHLFTIHDREDYTDIIVYTIDPEGCTDADDGFSFYEKENNTYLDIHIADPTDYIDIESELWIHMLDQCTTKYPSNNKPIHLLPENIMNIASLQDNINCKIKKAITLHIEIDRNTFLPKNNVELLFTNIKVDKSYNLTYSEATLIDLSIPLKIANELLKIRMSRTSGAKLSELSMAYPIYNNIISLYEDNEMEKSIKQMIGEFAIFTNTYVAKYLCKHLNTCIYRSCDTVQELDDDLTAENILNAIIVNGIKANYNSTISNHDLIGVPNYCHFTSPIRRVTDCVCHYLIKSIHLNIEHSLDLDNISKKCDFVSKSDKKIQFTDTKFRLLQIMSRMIEEEGKIHIKYYITNYKNGFLNVMICNINDYYVHLSYSLRIKYRKEINSDVKKITITVINNHTIYDEGTIPELDDYLINNTMV